MNPDNEAPPLTKGEQAILKRLERAPIELYWGRNGWVPSSLPKDARRKDFDSIQRREPELVEIRLAKLVLVGRTYE